MCACIAVYIYVYVCVYVCVCVNIMYTRTHDWIAHILNHTPKP